MQKWFDEGYFTPDLPMKRTHLDTQWILVEELILRSGGGKMFLTLPNPALPPGLSNRTESPMPNFPPDQHMFNGPYQPAPLRNLRSSTLDSFGSNPSDSPSSSFGGGRFGDASPDPNAFGGRGYFGDTSGGSRVAGFTALPDPASAFAGRRAFNEPLLDSSPGIRGPNVYGNMVNRGLVDNYGFNRAYSPGQGPWNTPMGPHSGFDASNINRSTNDPAYASNFVSGPVNGLSHIRGSQDNVFGETTYQQPLDYNSYNGLNGGSPAIAQQYNPSPTTQYATPQQLQQPPPPNVYGQHGIIPDTIQNNSQITNQLAAAPSPSLWNSEASTSRRPGPFEVAHPTSANTMIVQPTPAAEASPWGRTSQPSRPESRVNEPSPWVAASQGVIEENWKETPGPSSLTFSNVGQHNQQQQQLTPIDGTADIVDVLDQSPLLAAQPAPTATPEAAPTPPAKSKGKGSTQVNQAAAPKPAPPAPAPPVAANPSPPPVTPKPAWAKEDEAKKSKPSGVSISLREIQEAEAKKAEARKASERERERAARTAAPATETKDDAQPFTASWGLPTSQAGSRSSAPTPKDSAASSNPATPPVWTTSAKPPTSKKTMKEIQEEEERRKKTATKETAAATTRRAYAETTTKVCLSAVSRSDHVLTCHFRWSHLRYKVALGLL
jgi:PERQ amino acid-rich with GYF domain-containing protein